MKELGDIVMYDQSLTIKILALVNSAYYGFSQQISSINIALSLLGLVKVKNIIVAVAMKPMMSNQGDKELWKMAQEQIKMAAIDNNLEYFEAEGEAAFYGPKIDFMAEDAMGREHQLATIQLDFVQPERFGLTYVNEKGEK